MDQANMQRAAMALSCGGVVVRAAGGTKPMDGAPPGVRAARVSRSMAARVAAWRIAWGRAKECRRAQNARCCAPRVVNNVLRAQKGWGTLFGDVGVGRRWGVVERGRACSSSPHKSRTTKRLARSCDLRRASDWCTRAVFSSSLHHTASPSRTPCCCSRRLERRLA